MEKPSVDILKKIKVLKQNKQDKGYITLTKKGIAVSLVLDPSNMSTYDPKQNDLRNTFLLRTRPKSPSHAIITRSEKISYNKCSLSKFYNTAT